MTTHSPDDDLFGSDSPSTDSDAQPLDDDLQPSDDLQPLDDGLQPMDGGLLPFSDDTDGVVSSAPLEAELSDGIDTAPVNPLATPVAGPSDAGGDELRLMPDVVPAQMAGAPGVFPGGSPAGAAPSYPPGFGPTWPAGGTVPSSPWGVPGAPAAAGAFVAAGASVAYPGYPTVYPPPSSAYAAPSADSETFAWFLFICRAVGVMLAALLLLILLIIAWYQVIQNTGRFDPAEWTASEGDQAEASAKVAKVKAEIEITRQKIEAAKDANRELSERFGPPSSSYAHAEATLKSLSAVSWADAPHRCAEVRSFMTIPHFNERVQARLRGGMQTTEFEVGQFAHLVNELGDEQTQAAFQASIKTAGELRRRYQVQSSSMVTLMRATHPSLHLQRVPLLLEIGQFDPPIQEVLRSPQIKWTDHAILAFHPSEKTHEFVRKRLSPEELDAAALAALKGDPQFAQTAAEWLFRQEPQDARREKFVTALEPWLAIFGNNTYPAAVAYVRWSDKAQIPRVLELLDSPAHRLIAGNAIRLLARNEDPGLAAVIKQHFEDPDWRQALVPIIKDTDRVADAFVQAVQSAEPKREHLPLLWAWGDRSKKEDTTWLKEYAEKIPASQRDNAQSLYAECQNLLRRKGAPK